MRNGRFTVAGSTSAHKQTSMDSKTGFRHPRAVVILDLASLPSRSTADMCSVPCGEGLKDGLEPQFRKDRYTPPKSSRLSPPLSDMLECPEQPLPHEQYRSIRRHVNDPCSKPLRADRLLFGQSNSKSTSLTIARHLTFQLRPDRARQLANNPFAMSCQDMILSIFGVDKVVETSAEIPEHIQSSFWILIECSGL